MLNILSLTVAIIVTIILTVGVSLVWITHNDIYALLAIPALVYGFSLVIYKEREYKKRIKENNQW